MAKAGRTTREMMGVINCWLLIKKLNKTRLIGGVLKREITTFREKSMLG